jgi:tRNA (guanine37-N1)-methyltransferase
MYGVRVPFNKAQDVKKELIRQGVYAREYVPIKGKKDIYFPLSKQIQVGYPVVNKAFSKLSKKTYKDFLDNRQISQGLSSFDLIGDIAIINVNTNKREIADALIRSNKSIKTVLNKSGIREGEFRTQRLSWILGERKKETIHKENGVRIKLDVEKVYFSPRLSTERKRIYQKINDNEDVLVMFAGCGPYPLVISKNTKAKSIVGIEKNPLAVKYFKENLALNKIKNVQAICGDVRKVVPKLNTKFDRIIMPLPKDASTFLDVAYLASRVGTVVHLYDFEHENDFWLAKKKVEEESTKNFVKSEVKKVVVCGQYSPGKYRLCVDFVVRALST